jgi:hypothetical protein
MIVWGWPDRGPRPSHRSHGTQVGGYSLYTPSVLLWLGPKVPTQSLKYPNFRVQIRLHNPPLSLCERQ